MSHAPTLAAFVLASSLVACSGSNQAPAAAAPGSSAEAPAAATSSASPAGPKADADESVPTGSVVWVKPSAESENYVRVRILFENPTQSVCRFTSYTLIWPGGKKAIVEKPFDIPPGGKRQRTLKVHPDDGDISSLSPAKTQIDVAAGCSNQ